MLVCIHNRTNYRAAFLCTLISYFICMQACIHAFT